MKRSHTADVDGPTGEARTVPVFNRANAWQDEARGKPCPLRKHLFKKNMDWGKPCG